MSTTLRQPMSEQDVRRAYRRWAKIYDSSLLGYAVRRVARDAIASVNQRQGSLLEVGVGTGTMLPRYASHLKITGIDLSPEMLARAKQRVERKGLKNIRDLMEMDAADLRFADESFETVVAMFVMTVVPDPKRVLRELERVVRPGGRVVIVNHFRGAGGLRERIENRLAAFSRGLGWHPDFPVETITDNCRLSLIEKRALKPFGIFTMLQFEKPRTAQTAPPIPHKAE